MLPWWYSILILQFWPMDAPPELWHYDDTGLWNNTFLLCAAPLQSPIALSQNRVVFWQPPRVVGAPGLAAGQLKVVNTGRRLEWRPRPANRSAPAVQLISYKKPLFGVYSLEEVHFHWGDVHGQHGSEHAIAGRFSEAEAQFVFYSSFYGSLRKARRQPGGLAVVSVLLRQSDAPGSGSFATFGLEDRLDELGGRDDSLTLPADLTPLRQLLQAAVTKVYTYYGSLTSPPCNPVVSWLVATSEVQVNERFLRGLVTKLYQDRDRTQPLVNNWRPLQARKGRTVTKQLTVGKGV